jgi:hypothetical protein
MIVRCSNFRNGIENRLEIEIRPSWVRKVHRLARPIQPTSESSRAEVDQWAIAEHDRYAVHSQNAVVLDWGVVQRRLKAA